MDTYFLFVFFFYLFYFSIFFYYYYFNPTWKCQDFPSILYCYKRTCYSHAYSSHAWLNLETCFSKSKKKNKKTKNNKNKLITEYMSRKKKTLVEAPGICFRSSRVWSRLLLSSHWMGLSFFVLLGTKASSSEPPNEQLSSILSSSNDIFSGRPLLAELEYLSVKLCSCCSCSSNDWFVELFFFFFVLVILWMVASPC